MKDNNKTPTPERKKSLFTFSTDKKNNTPEAKRETAFFENEISTLPKLLQEYSPYDNLYEIKLAKILEIIKNPLFTYENAITPTAENITLLQIALNKGLTDVADALISKARGMHSDKNDMFKTSTPSPVEQNTKLNILEKAIIENDLFTVSYCLNNGFFKNNIPTKYDIYNPEVIETLRSQTPGANQYLPALNNGELLHLFYQSKTKWFYSSENPKGRQATVLMPWHIEISEALNNFHKTKQDIYSSSFEIKAENNRKSEAALKDNPSQQITKTHETNLQLIKTAKTAPNYVKVPTAEERQLEEQLQSVRRRFSQSQNDAQRNLEEYHRRKRSSYSEEKLPEIVKNIASTKAGDAAYLAAVEDFLKDEKLAVEAEQLDMKQKFHQQQEIDQKNFDKKQAALKATLIDGTPPQKKAALEKLEEAVAKAEDVSEFYGKEGSVARLSPEIKETKTPPVLQRQNSAQLSSDEETPKEKKPGFLKKLFQKKPKIAPEVESPTANKLPFTRQNSAPLSPRVSSTSPKAVKPPLTRSASHVYSIAPNLPATPEKVKRPNTPIAASGEPEKPLLSEIRTSDSYSTPNSSPEQTPPLTPQRLTPPAPPKRRTAPPPPPFIIRPPLPPFSERLDAQKIVQKATPNVRM